MPLMSGLAFKLSLVQEILTSTLSLSLPVPPSGRNIEG